MLLENRSSPEHDEDTSVDTESKVLGRQRAAQLERWISEDKFAGDTCCSRALRLWKNDVVARLSSQPGGLALPRRLKLPGCLAHACGLLSSSVKLMSDGSVKILVFDRASGKYLEGMELIPAAH